MILLVYIIFIVGVLVGLLWIKQKLNQRTITKDFERIFKDSQIKLPNLRLGTSYSWPTFDITFSTKDEMELAQTTGLIDKFKEKLKPKYSKDFDADRAVYCSFVGHIPTWTTIINEEKIIGTDKDESNG